MNLSLVKHGLTRAGNMVAEMSGDMQTEMSVGGFGWHLNRLEKAARDSANDKMFEPVYAATRFAVLSRVVRHLYRLTPMLSKK